MHGIQSQDILYDTGIMLCPSLTIRRRIEARGGFPAIFGVGRSAVSATVTAVYESAQGAMQRIAARKRLTLALTSRLTESAVPLSP
jgi:hypothetical protein